MREPEAEPMTLVKRKCRQFAHEGQKQATGCGVRSIICVLVMVSRISRVASQPDQDSSIDAELWTFGGLVVMLYTAVIVLITAIACWVTMRTPDPPDGSGPPGGPGEEQFVDRLWGLPDDGNVLGGMWDVWMRKKVKLIRTVGYLVSLHKFANNENWDVMSNNEVEVNEGFPPPFGRGAHHQRSRIYRPGEGRTRPNTPHRSTRARQPRGGAEEPNASTWLLGSTSPRQGAFRRRRTGSSSTVGESQSEVSGSFDGEGHFTVRFRQRGVDALGRRRRSTEAQTEPATGAFPSETASMVPQEGGAEEVPQVVDEAEVLAAGPQNVASVIQSAEPNVIPTAEPNVIQSAEPNVIQTAEPNVIQTAETEVIQTEELNVIQTAEGNVMPSAGNVEIGGKGGGRPVGAPSSSSGGDVFGGEGVQRVVYPNVWTAPSGEVYHTQRTCGKLRAAKRIRGTSPCTLCVKALANRRPLDSDEMIAYHLDPFCPQARAHVRRQMRACAECGGRMTLG